MIEKPALFLCLVALTTTGWCTDVPRVDGYINGQPARFIVDTGASEVVIPQALAKRLGIAFRQGEMARYETAGGPVAGHRIVLESLKVANVEALGVVAHVPAGDSGLQEPLLGMSFLKHITMTLHSGTVSFSP
ncbi:MAG: retropepsin-like aspartic protease [Pseudomonadota bacterium]